MAMSIFFTMCNRLFCGIKIQHILEQLADMADRQYKSLLSLVRNKLFFFVFGLFRVFFFFVKHKINRDISFVSTVQCT